MKDYILTNIPSSKIPFNRMAKAEVGLGLSMGGKFGRKSLSSSEYKLDYKNGKVAIILSRGGKRRVKYIIEDDPDYLKTIQKFANDYLNRFVNENKLRRKFKSLNEANEGDRFVHKYSPEIEIELIEPTNRGWKVKQTTGRKSKTAFFDKQDIMGGKAIFKPIKESLRRRLRKLIREEIQRFNEGMESGLMVYPSTPRDKAKIQKWLNSSDYYGEWAREGYFLFPEERSSYDSLEDELGREFLKHKINARFEGV